MFPGRCAVDCFEPEGAENGHRSVEEGVPARGDEVPDAEQRESAVAAHLARTEQRLVLQQLLECLVIYYRDLAVLAATGDTDRLFNSELAGKDAGEMNLDRAIDRTEAALTAIEHVDSNVNEQLALDNLFTWLAAGR